MRLPLPNKQFATLISVYAPTLTNPDSVKEKFYDNLNSTISTVPRKDKLIILGDFNARVGREHKSWPRVIGKNGTGNCNSNGSLLLETCTKHNLLITNTVFSLPKRNRTTWMHPRSKHWHLLDYVIVRQEDRQDVRLTQATLTEELSVKLFLLEQTDNVEEDWRAFRDTVYSTALGLVGPTVRKHQDWFDDNDEHIQSLLKEKHRLHKALLNNPASVSCQSALKKIKSTIQRDLRHMQNSWLSNKAEEIQSYADRNDSKNFYSALRTIYCPTSSGSSPLLSADGKSVITDQAKTLERWAEHFHGVLNRPSAINEAAIERLPQVPINQSLNDPPSDAEVAKAKNKLSSGKATLYQQKFTLRAAP